VDRYLGCADEGSAKEKQDNYDAALNLEKAIASVREDDENFANSLNNRMYFLKACGDFGKDGRNGDISEAFKNAYAAIAIDRNGAYIQNKLALLHLQNGNKDSALYYAEKATRTAPKWACAFTTLALVKKATEQNNNNSNLTKPKPKLPHRNSFGFILGAGVNKPKPSIADTTANSPFTEVSSQNGSTFDIGIFYNSAVGKNLAIRPVIHLISDRSDVLFTRKSVTGGQITQVISFSNVSLNASLPFVFRFTNKKIAPYISLAPTFSYVIKQNAKEVLPFKKLVVLGDAGLGLDIEIPKAGIVLSPEFKYSAGFSDMNDNASNTAYSKSLYSLKRNAFMFNLYLRRR
jgi:tetratricopeptide (TPR) repeat protein